MQDQLWEQQNMVQPLEEGDPRTTRSEESETFTLPLIVKIQQHPLASSYPRAHAALSAPGMKLLDKDWAGTVARVLSAEEPRQS